MQVSEILDSELLGEGLIPTLQQAHDMLLAENPKTVPYRATTYAQACFLLMLVMKGSRSCQNSEYVFYVFHASICIWEILTYFHKLLFYLDGLSGICIIENVETSSIWRLSTWRCRNMEYFIYFPSKTLCIPRVTCVIIAWKERNKHQLNLSKVSHSKVVWVSHSKIVRETLGIIW